MFLVEGHVINTTCLGHVTEFCELVCILLLLTKVSHTCGWHCLPANWAGYTNLRFMVDIITLGINRNSSDWLIVHSYQDLYATRIRCKQPSWLVRSLELRKVNVNLKMTHQ